MVTFADPDPGAAGADAGDSAPAGAGDSVGGTKESSFPEIYNVIEALLMVAPGESSTLPLILSAGTVQGQFRPYAAHLRKHGRRAASPKTK
jgi:hypothetical protein